MDSLEVSNSSITGNENDGKFSFINVVDDRVMQSGKSLYPIVKSNSTVNQVNVTSTSATQALLSFQSPNIQPSFFVDRAITLSGKMRFQVTVTINANILAANLAASQFFFPGVDISPCALPFNEGIALQTTLLNDNVISTTQVQDVKDALIRLSNYRKNLAGRAGPSCPDYAVNYQDVYLSNLNSCANINDVNAFTGFIPNATYAMEFSADGAAWQTTPLTGTQIAAANPGRLNVGGDLLAGNVTCYVRLTFNEPLLSSPWIYNDSKEFKDVALTGVKNFAININMNNGSRCLRTINQTTVVSTTTYTLSGIVFDANAFEQSSKPQLNYVLLSAPESFAIERPLKNRIHVINVERNLKQATGLGVAANNSTAQYVSDIINLSRVPYLLVIGARPSSYTNAGQGDWVYALQDNNPINISFNNVPGKCSTFNKLQLYNSARYHGLEDSYLTWSGTIANKGSFPAAGGAPTAASVPLSGGWIVLQPGIDFSLDDISLSPGSLCNCPMQVTLNVKNQSGIDYSAVQTNYYIFALYNDFVETDTVLQKSQTITGVIDSQAVLKADKTQPSASENELMQKYLGGGALHNMRRAHRRHHKHWKKALKGGKKHSHMMTHAEGGRIIGGEAGGKRVSHSRRMLH